MGKVYSNNRINRTTVKPFLKWAGGKGQLLSEIEKYYPFANGKITKYAEPFVGGGAVLFDILSKFDLESVYISDTNQELINTYCVIRDDIDRLIDELKVYQEEYIPAEAEERKILYSSKRARFNLLKCSNNPKHRIEEAALMIFLNRTCFNGLYRVNKKGLFNVPMGAYKNPTICDEYNLRAVSDKLQNVEIVCGDYRLSSEFIDQNTFVYFDPPYRPLTATASFTAYTECLFNDEAQIILSEFVNEMNQKGARILVSNSDPKNTDVNDNFFDEIYASHSIKRVEATRMINCNGENRGVIKEILISNFGERGTMYLDKTKEELTELFEQNLLSTNRGFNYYVDWGNITGYQDYICELNAMDSLIGRKEDFDHIFKMLLERMPSVVETFPFLFALSKAERSELKKNNKKFKVIGTEIDSDDLQEFDFSKEKSKHGLTSNDIAIYLQLFEQMGLKYLFQELLERSVVDYVVGVLVGLDSNGRKNRGGKAFELACDPIIRDLCKKYSLSLLSQKQFKTLRQKGINVSNDIANRKADFIIVDENVSKCLNIEVNFFNDAGSKPEEIIDSYINRQSDLGQNGISFALITDGNCWRGTTNQLEKGFRYLNYLMNFKLAKQGMLEEMIIREFGER